MGQNQSLLSILFWDCILYSIGVNPNLKFISFLQDQMQLHHFVFVEYDLVSTTGMQLMYIW